nr:hypothetical protein [Tanacetum cinerariifolium]
MILESIKNGLLIWPSIEENGMTRPNKYSEFSPTEAIQADCDIKATNIILQGLPPEEMECKLYDEFDKFAYKKGETLHDFYLRFSLLLNDMNIYNMKLEQFHDLHTTNIDQLHAYLGQHEFHANEVRLMHERNDPIDAINHMMSFFTAVITSRYLTTNNQLRNSSNPRQQATINNGRVTLQPIQGRQTSLAAEEGHMSKQCTKPKRKRDDSWFKDKVLLVQAQANGQNLHEEELAFLADPRIAEAQATQTVITHNADIKPMIWMHMTLIAMPCSEQSNIVNHLKTEITSDRNIISYSYYVSESQHAAIQNSNSTAQQAALILSKAQQLETKLYDGNVIEKTNSIVIHNSEETLMLAEESHSKRLLKQKYPKMSEKKFNTTPVEYAVLNQLSQDFKTRFVPQTELSAEQSVWSQNSVNSLEPTPSSRPTKVEVPKELPKVIMTYKQLYDSIKSSRIRSKEQCDDLINQVNLKSVENFDLNASLQEKVLVITALKDNLRKLKGKPVVDDVVPSHPVDPELLKVDIAPLAPKLRNNRTVHSDYLRHTQEETTTLKEIVANGCDSNEQNQKRNACPLTRFTTTAKVPFRKPIALESNTPKPVVTLVYSRIMSITKEQQQALDEALVPREQRRMIGSCNYRLSTVFKPKEPTFQVYLDVLSHSFLSSLLDHNPPFEEDILTFMRELGYSSNIKFLSDHEVVQKYGAILPDYLTTQAMKKSKAYKTYHDLATGKVQPKPKYVHRSSRSKTEQAPKPFPGKSVKATAKVAKSGKKKQPALGLETLTEVALTDPEQLKLATKRSLIRTHSSHASGSEEDDDEANIGKDEYDNNQEDDDNTDHDDSERTDSDNNGDDFVHPKFLTHDDEASHGMNVKGEELDDKGENEEDDGNELYRDVNINLEGQDIQMEDVQTTQVIEDTHVTLTPVNPKDQQQSLSVSSRIVLNMLNPSPNTCIDFIFNLNIKSTPQVDVSVTTTVEPPLLSATTLPLPSTPIIPHLQQTPVPSPTNVPSSSLQDLPNFGSLFRDEAQAENKDLLNKLNENIQKIIKEQVKEQVKAQVSKILPKIKKTVNEQLKAEVLTRSSNSSKTSHAIATNLSELELKKILIDKMESNKSIHKSDE